eukprot:6781902-Alexandrium_andersonii.AAC.1
MAGGFSCSFLRLPGGLLPPGPPAAPGGLPTPRTPPTGASRAPEVPMGGLRGGGSPPGSSGVSGGQQPP